MNKQTAVRGTLEVIMQAESVLDSLRLCVRQQAFEVDTEVCYRLLEILQMITKELGTDVKLIDVLQEVGRAQQRKEDEDSIDKLIESIRQQTKAN